MKKLRLTLLLSLSLSFLMAQSTKIQWGNTFGEDIVGIVSNHIFKADKTNYYVHSGSRKKNTLYKFDVNNTLLFEKPLVLEHEKKSYGFNLFAQTKSGVYGIASPLGQYANKKKVFIGKITDNGVENFRLFKTYDYGNPRGEKDANNRDITEQVKVSKDGSKVLHFDILSTSDYKGGNEKFVLHVLDDKLQPLWEKRIDLNINDKSALIEDISFTNDEVVWVTIKMFEGKVKKYETPYRYSLLKITKDKKETFDLKLKDDLLIASMKIDFDEAKGSAFASGTFTHSDNREFIKGVFSGYFDAEKGSIDYVSIYPFSETEEEKTGVLGMFGAKKYFERTADHYKVKQIVKLPNGGYKTLVEYAAFTFKQGFSKNSDRNYRLRNFIIFNTHDNKVKDIVFIERKLAPENEQDAFLTLKGENAYLFYNHMPIKSERKKLNITTSFSTLLFVKKLDAQNKVISTEILRSASETLPFISELRHVRFGDKIILGGVHIPLRASMPQNVKRNSLYGIYDLE